jgi:hypothetical protein
MENIFEFGTFFHSVRVAKGLALMNFCRENNFNVLFVSNIERGKAVPSKEEVTSYVRALKLRRGTKDYKKFIELYDKLDKEKDVKSILFEIPKEKLDQVIKIIS